MQDETLSQQLPLPRPRRTLTTLLVALLAFALGGLVIGWLLSSGGLANALPGLFEVGSPDAVLVEPAPSASKPAVSLPAAPAADIPPALGAVETRLALLEDRLSRIDSEATAASGNAARAEALLIAYAARRRIDKGEQLGFLEDQLRLRFGGTQPRAVETIIDASKSPVTLDELSGQLESAAPELAGAIIEEGTWARIRRELASLFVVRRAPTTATTPSIRLARAQVMLASGKIDEAIAEVQRLPGAENAQGWIEAAQRYEAAQRALEVIETAAMLEPRTLRDGEGKPIEQGSPLAPPAGAPPEVVG